MDEAKTYDEKNELMFCGVDSPDWDQLNLKTFFSIFALQHPEVKQADIAKSLGITAATLSRVINGTYGDKKIRPNWIPEFKSLIMQLDIKKFQEQWDTIKRIHDEYERAERQSKLRRIITNIEEFDGFYNNNWIRNDSLLYYGNSASHLFFEILDDCLDERALAQMRRYLGYFNGDGRTKKFCVHFVCYSMKVFEQCVDFIADDSNSNRLASKGIMFSAMWVDLAKEKIMEEYHPYRLY